MKLALLLIAALMLAPAQAFPTKPVRVIVAFTPGGVTDIIARSVTPKLAELWGQPVVVENRPGAGGSLAAQVVARAPADGYMLLVHSSGYAINAAINPALPYDPRRDFVDVAPLASQPMVLVVSPSSGIGSGAHFNAEQFRIAANLELLHVPYKGGNEAINDTVAGRLAFTFNTITLALPYIRDGRVLAIGVSAAQRSSLLPEAPTIAESGLPGFEFTFWNGLWAPAGTPAAVTDKIARDVAQVLAAAEVRERLARLGAEPMAMAPGEFARFVRREMETAERISRISGIKAQ